MKLILDLLSKLLRLAALVLAIAAAVAAVLALGGAIDDRLDAISHLAPFFLAGGIAALALHLVTPGERGGVTPVLAAIAILAAGGLMAPDVIAAARDHRATPSGETLKLVQFNLWGRNRDPQGSARWILKEDPDVVVLEEAFDNSMVVPKALARRFPYRTTCAEPQICSTMILATARPRAEGGLETKGALAHLSGAWASFGAPDTGYTVVGVHYTWPIPAGPQQSQSRRLARAMEGFNKASLILAGDFNSTPWSFSLHRQDARFGLIRRTHALFTWPAAPFSRQRINSPLPFLPIDHVYAGAAWRTVDVHRGPRLGSDHYPVVITLTRSPAEPPPAGP